MLEDPSARNTRLLGVIETSDMLQKVLKHLKLRKGWLLAGLFVFIMVSYYRVHKKSE